MRKSVAFAALALLALGACQQSKPDAAPKEEASKAAPEAKPGIELTEGKLVLPAVSANPGAAYFQINNSAGASTVIAAIRIDGVSRTEVHQTMADSMTNVDQVEIAPSTSIKFEPGGLHVMAFGVDSKLKAGETTEMTVTFADGDKASLPLKIEAPGGGGDHGASH